MGCGGSRTDALEPRYPETWTKDTESTWLTATDADIPVSSIQSICSEGSEAGITSQRAASPGEKNGQLISRQEQTNDPYTSEQNSTKSDPCRAIRRVSLPRRQYNMRGKCDAFC